MEITTNNMMTFFSGKNNENAHLHIRSFRFYLSTKHLPKKLPHENEDEDSLTQFERARIQVFAQTLQNSAQIWFQKIKWGRNPGEIHDLEGLLKAFESRFKRDQAEKCHPSAALLTTRQTPQHTPA